MNHLNTWIIATIAACLFTSSTVHAEEADDLLKGDAEIVVDFDTEVGEMYNFWNVYPVTDQSPFLDEQQFDQLRQKYRYAKYINCVRLLGGIDEAKDNYFRGVDDRGEAVCDFSEAIAMLQGIRKCGFTPWIVLDNVPAEMSTNPTLNRYGNTEPPADFDLWSSYVRQFIQSLVDQFGQEEVLKWRFRVGTEPDLNPGHWTGTKEQWLKHYDYSVAAVRGVLPGAEIGPGNVVAPLKARRQKSWAPAIINHCASGTNQVSGQTGTPLNFFGSSYYTNVGKTDRNFDDVVAYLRRKLNAHPESANIPVEIQEFGILNEGGKRLIGDGTEFGGSWLAHMAEKTYENQIRRVYQWDWNTNKGGDLPTPITHVMDMLEEMNGGTRLSAVASPSNQQDHLGCLAVKNAERIDLLVFRHLAERANGQSAPVRLTLNGNRLASKDWTLTRASLIDGEHAGFMSKRDADVKKLLAKFADHPRPHAVALRRAMAVNRNEYEPMSQLHSLDPFPKPTLDPSGQMHFDLTMDGHSVIFLRLE